MVVIMEDKKEPLENPKNENYYDDDIDWFELGCKMDPTFEKSYCYPDEISLRDVEIINSLCLFENEPHQIVDKGRIESALGNQFQPYPRRELAYASVYKSLVINHGFMNGNKRTAVIVLYLASKMTGNELNISDKDLAALTYRIASEGGSKISVEDIADKVFKCYATVGDINVIQDVAFVAKEFIESHEWLMKELGK